MFGFEQNLETKITLTAMTLREWGLSHQILGVYTCSSVLISFSVCLLYIFNVHILRPNVPAGIFFHLVPWCSYLLLLFYHLWTKEDIVRSFFSYYPKVAPLCLSALLKLSAEQTAAGVFNWFLLHTFLCLIWNSTRFNNNDAPGTNVRAHTQTHTEWKISSEDPDKKST